jgi:Zn-dependent oligopeptidase
MERSTTPTNGRMPLPKSCYRDSKKEGLRNKQTANDHRHKVLAVTGTRSSGELVKDFLGRDFGVKAYADKLSK